MNTTSLSNLLSEIKILKREMKKSNLYRKRIYTIKEAAHVLGVSISYIQKLVSSNQIKYSRPSGKLIFIRRRDLEKFVMRNTVLPNDEIETISSNHLMKIKNRTI